MTRPLASRLLALAFLTAAVSPWAFRQVQRRQVCARIDRLARSAGPDQSIFSSITPYAPDPALMVRVSELGPLLASWQTIGGCGAGSGTGGAAGLKWIGRGVSGGLFNVVSQGTYTRIHNAGKLEHHFFLNSLITRDLSQKWVLGVNVPLIYKYMTDYVTDPFDASQNIDVSNGGLGDLSIQLSRKFGRINDTVLTAIVGAPTGSFDARFRGGKYLLQQQQLGFGMPTVNLVLDHAMDEIWGVIVVGGVASWRGGENKINNYRSPSATTYAYTGYFLGPFVPAVGLSVTGYKEHDRDQTLTQTSPLFSMAGNVSVEWSTDWVAVLAGASMPYVYDGISTQMGSARSPWGWGPWTVALGLALSPF